VTALAPTLQAFFRRPAPRGPRRRPPARRSHRLRTDDAAAKQTLSRIVADGGMRPIDAGPLKRAHEIEALGYLHMVLQKPLDTNYASAVKVLW
jgi:predicted dinucleotide-binding enzyme